VEADSVASDQDLRWYLLLLLTAYLALVIWGNFVAKPPDGSDEVNLAASYGLYFAKEYPKRGDQFVYLASMLGLRSKAVAVLRADVLRYLGKPDFTRGTPDAGMLVYICYPSGGTDQCGVYANLKEGKLAEVGFNAVGVNDRSGFQPYLGEPAPNPQGGASGSQPFSSDTNRASAAATSGRSP
jgi:hypothetical protein